MSEKVSRKCCQEFDKRKKSMERNLKCEKMGTKFFIWLVNFHAFKLHEWREEYNSDIITCSKCSRFKDKLPVGMFIELKFDSSSKSTPPPNSSLLTKG